MAENEQADGALEVLEPVPGAKGKLKLMIAVVGLLAIVGGGSAIWYFFARHAGDEMQADGEPRWVPRTRRRPGEGLRPMTAPAPWRCNGAAWSRTAAATAAAGRTAASVCGRRKRSRICSVSAPVKSASTIIPAFEPAS